MREGERGGREEIGGTRDVSLTNHSDPLDAYVSLITIAAAPLLPLNSSHDPLNFDIFPLEIIVT